jgi:hypothetical protein
MMDPRITGPFEEEPILDELAEQVLDAYQMIALRHPGLTDGEFRTLAYLLNRLRARWGQEATPDVFQWTPRRVNDVRNLDRKGWIRADEPLADWYERHIGKPGGR